MPSRSTVISKTMLLGAMTCGNIKFETSVRNYPQDWSQTYKIIYLLMVVGKLFYSVPAIGLMSLDPIQVTWGIPLFYVAVFNVKKYYPNLP